MLWVSYGKFSKEGIKGLVAEPQNRAESLGKLIESYGGKLISYYMVLNGDIDFFIVTDIPEDKMEGIAFINAMLVRASGSFESLTTVPTIPAENAVPQMQKAQQMAAAMAYKAPAKG